MYFSSPVNVSVSVCVCVCGGVMWGGGFKGQVVGGVGSETSQIPENLWKRIF